MSHADDFADDAVLSLDRREFLKVLSASFAALGTSACDFRQPAETVVPFLVQPEDATPGVARWYASTCQACPASCGVLVKSREGRPIKVEGNPEHPLSGGGLCARGQASVIDLYDSARPKGPRVAGSDASWATLDREVSSRLAEIDREGGKVRVLSHTITSPTLLAAIADFARAHRSARHVVYDPFGASALLEAYAATHGERRLPWYRFEKARTIVSFDADFLGTWLSPVEFARGWAVGRRLEPARPTMSWHAQFEARYSVTGAKADLRVPLAPSAERATVLALARRVTEAVRPDAAARLPEGGDSPVAGDVLDLVASELVSARGRALVVSGSADRNVQALVHIMNHVLDAEGATIDLEQPSLQYAGDDAAFERLLEEMEAGEVAALVVVSGNPAHDHPRAARFRKALERVGLSVSLSPERDETAGLVGSHAPDHHALESWGDAHPHVGVYGLLQPLLAPLFSTRAAVTSLSTWAGAGVEAYAALQRYWRDVLFARQEEAKTFDGFWTKALQDGAVVFASERLPRLAFDLRALDRIEPPAAPRLDDGFEPVVYASVALGDGRQANNPWLQELPDPIGKTTWMNVASISPAAAARLGVVDGRVLRIRGGGVEVELPARVQPGLPDAVVAMAAGHGRLEAGPIAGNFPTRKLFAIDYLPAAGADVYPLAGAGVVSVEATDRMEPLARTQTYDWQTVPFTGQTRPIALATTLAEYERDPAAGNVAPRGGESLWPERKYPVHKWEMSIDLNLCTGCAACVASCMLENNVPVVGRAEVAKFRDMQWIKIDRYYSGSEAEPDPHPKIAFVPVLCQHCDNAPCETVCPVVATAHSTEGLSMQVYNRCVGTRYCANNCPYKARRFNWFDYAHDDLLQNLALNPDVTVRTRGVMEKCTFCVQRISEAKSTARGEDRPIADGEVRPACAQSCPTEAIQFGDANDRQSEVSAAKRDPRAYRLLADVGTRPAVHYLTQVRNEKA